MVNPRHVTPVWRVGLQLEIGLERAQIERDIKKSDGGERRERDERESYTSERKG